MYTVKDVEKMISGVSDELLFNAISKGSLKLSDEQIGTVSFAFWLCFLAERDLEYAIKGPWEKLSETFDPKVMDEAKAFLNDFVFGTRKPPETLQEALKDLPKEVADNIRSVVKENYDEKRKVDVDNLPYITDKIKLYEGMAGSNNVSAVLWQIKEIRNDLSHGRFEKLSYNGEPLSLRKTKENILIDYLNAVNNPDHSHSPLKEALALTPQQEEQIDQLFDQLV